jgi:hypothetical protein
VVAASHNLDRLQVTFDDPNLVANAGLLLPGTLARKLGVSDIVDERVDLSGRVGGANCGIKAMTVISALLAGAEWIDDTDVLRAGGSEIACGHEVRAPSTIGTWLRAFTWGHVRQLEAAAGEVLARAWAAGGGPGSSEPVVVDLDSTFCETYGLGKQGAWKVNRDGERGYHPLVSVINGYDQLTPRSTCRDRSAAPACHIEFNGVMRRSIGQEQPSRSWNYIDGTRPPGHIRKGCFCCPTHHGPACRATCHTRCLNAVRQRDAVITRRRCPRRRGRICTSGGFKPRSPHRRTAAGPRCWTSSPETTAPDVLRSPRR